MRTFLGKPVELWIELDKKVSMLEDGELVQKLMLENRQLRAELSFYKARIREIVLFEKTSSDEDLRR